MPELKNVVLDMGNVLLRYDPQVALDRFCHTDEAKERIRKELFLGPEWAQGDLGLIREEEKFDLVKRRVPKELWEPLKQCCEQWDVCMKPLPGALEFCRAVKGAAAACLFSPMRPIRFTAFSRGKCPQSCLTAS